MKLTKLLGKKLKEIRKSKGFTQQELAEMCNIHTTTIAMIEIGQRKPSLKTIDAFVSSLDINYSDLFDFNNEYNIEKSDDELKIELGRVIADFNRTMLKHLIVYAKSIKELSQGE